MNRRLVSALIFVAGAAAGSVTTYFAVKTKIQKSADEKFEEAISEYKNSRGYHSPKPVEKKGTKNSLIKEEKTNDEDIYKEVASRYGYSEKGKDYTKCADQKNEEEDSDDDCEACRIHYNDEDYPEHERPYVITPDEFGEDYDTESYMYYEDGIVADDNDNIIDDVEGTIGFECLGRIGEYETGCIHVRNDVLKKDYEVLKSLRRYSEVAAQRGIFTED